jgi:hypothetical protein
MSTRRLVSVFAILASLAASGAGQGSAQPNAFESFRGALVDYFAPQNYVPVLVNRGYTVGDVVEVDGVNFYARSVRCFPRSGSHRVYEGGDTPPSKFAATSCCVGRVPGLQTLSQMDQCR